jgi:hypothetical protein
MAYISMEDVHNVDLVRATDIVRPCPQHSFLLCRRHQGCVR